jgi:hypothetical protein
LSRRLLGKSGEELYRDALVDMAISVLVHYGWSEHVNRATALSRLNGYNPDAILTTAVLANDDAVTKVERTQPYTTLAAIQALSTEHESPRECD